MCKYININTYLIQLYSHLLIRSGDGDLSDSVSESVQESDVYAIYDYNGITFKRFIVLQK